MNAEVIGVICGIVVGLIICAIFFIATNSNHKMRTDYDERQDAVRGRSYKYGFYTAEIYFAFLTVLYMAEISMPFTLSVQAFFGIFLSVLVVAIHSIWNNAYWGLNNNKKKYFILGAVCTVINLGVGIMHIVDGTILLGTQGPVINLLCGIMLVIVGINVAIKDKFKSEADSDDDEEE